MIDWPEYLIEAIARRKCVLFLGSGISANACNDAGKHPLTWEAFLRDILAKRSDKLEGQKDVIEQTLRLKDYLTACEIIVETLGDNDFGELAANEFRRPGYKPSDIHEAVYRLDSRLVLTPNIDKIYEQYAMNESHSTVVVKSYYEDDIAKYLRTDDFLIIRVHGYVDNVSKIIFTHRQYSEARCKYASFYRMLDALILTHTFIFLGCGISDPDIQLILENMNFLYPGCLPHYFVAAKDTYSKEIERSLLHNRNLELLTYDNPDGTHQQLLNELKELINKVEEKREEISAKGIW
ncbi:MAG TPA: SIR2 family protein [Candidatus Scatomonas pullistercoris]|uniref:SIR2 family protein n=1 Tax=Candidatus Scatomonas pullistercoris TaxID=2840920 RepID=A0A9D1P108_9FIRM|nr:SIR2 family protein [Candidatus Scatomonas pullistercoris]